LFFQDMVYEFCLEPRPASPNAIHCCRNRSPPIEL